MNDRSVHLRERKRDRFISYHAGDGEAAREGAVCRGGRGFCGVKGAQFISDGALGVGDGMYCISHHLALHITSCGMCGGYEGGECIRYRGLTPI